MLPVAWVCSKYIPRIIHQVLALRVDGGVVNASPYQGDGRGFESYSIRNFWDVINCQFYFVTKCYIKTYSKLCKTLSGLGILLGV